MNIKKIVSFVTTSKVKLIAISISALLLIGGALFVNGVISQNKSLREDNYRLINNVSQYESLAAGLRSDNRVLRLFRDDLRHSNDSLIQEIEKIKKSRKSPENKPGSITAGGTTSIDAKDTVIIDNTVDFKLDTTVYYNEFTKSTIKIEKDSLFSGIKVNNTQVLYVYPQREYVNKYKNGWHRFWNFDYKKTEVVRYELINTNDLIKVDDFRVYKIEE